jgi:hypothetical protein
MNKQTISDFFTSWLHTSTSTIITWTFAIVGSLGYSITNGIFTHPDSVVVYSVIVLIVIVVPPFIALALDVKQKLPRDKRAIPNNTQFYFKKYAIFSALLITFLISVETGIFVDSVMIDVAQTTDAETSENFPFLDNLIQFLAVFIIPPYLFGMACFIRKMSFID